MRDHQWRLAYDGLGGHPGADVTFGTLDTGVITLVPPEVTPGDTRAADVEPAGADGTQFGVDRRGGITVAFEIGVDTVDSAGDTGWAGNADAVNALAAAWRADAVRHTPGACATLTACQGGRERLLYGRPRRFATADERFSPRGYTAVVADFVAAVDLWFDAQPTVEQVPLVPSSAGGLIAPLAAPLSTVAVSSNTGAVDVGGSVPTWPVITIHGPIVDPVVEAAGLWQVGMVVTLAYDRSVTIDPRPWMGATVTRDDGASLAGAFTRYTPLLSDIVLPPGRHEVTLRGRDDTGTAYAELSWQAAHTGR